MHRLRSLPFASSLGALIWISSTATWSAEAFLRGDVDESLRLDVTDAVRIFQFLFLGKPDSVPCQDAADVNDNGKVELADGVFLLNFLFRQGNPPPAPFPECGSDPTQDPLECDRHDGCEFRLDIPGLKVTGDGVFLVVDRSDTMQDAGELIVAKKLAVRLLGALPERAQFGVVFAASDVIEYPVDFSPAPATAGNKASATKFVQSTFGSVISCPHKGLSAALKFVDASTARSNVILFLTDGGGTCGGADESANFKQTLEAVAKENHGRARIYTLGMLHVEKLQEKFLNDLASQNGGSYVFIKR